MLPETGKISLDNVRNELNIKGPISLGQIEVRKLAGQDIPPKPQECDYYFETREDFDARRDAIIAENNNDLSQKTFGFGDGVTSLEYAFYEKSIKSTPKMIFARNVTSFRDCFSYCRSLTTIHQGLFDNCPNVTSFCGCFDYCYSLTTIPKGLFDNCPNVTNFSYCFRGCSSLTSSLPDVWNKNKFPKVVSGEWYAYGCTNAANYNEVPDSFNCFDGESIINTKNGIKQIKNLNNNDYIEVDIDVFDKINKITKYKNTFQYSIILENGNKILITEEHPIVTDYGYGVINLTSGKKLTMIPDDKIKQLQINDNILTTNGYSKVISITKINNTNKEIYTYDIRTNSDHIIVDNILFFNNLNTEESIKWYNSLTENEKVKYKIQNRAPDRK